MKALGVLHQLGNLHLGTVLDPEYANRQSRVGEVRTGPSPLKFPMAPK
jgi:hypothetical protein